MITKSIQDIKVGSGRHAIIRRSALFLSILLSGGMLVLPRIPILILVVFLGLLAARFRVVTLRRIWPVFLLISFVLLVTLVRPGPLHFESFIIRYANFFCAIVLLNTYLIAPKSALVDDLNMILRWMAWQAVVTVVLAHTLGFLFTTVNYLDTSFKTILLVFNYHVLFENSTGLYRPNGFFYEPGVLQIYLNIYLYLVLFVSKNYRQAILAGAAVFLTQSTTGILIAMILIGVAFLKQISKGSFGSKLSTIVFALMVVPPAVFLGYNNVSEKLFGEAQGSSWAREYDFYTGLNVISNYPLLGIGFDHQRYLTVAGRLSYTDTNLSAESLTDRTTSNGLIYLFYSLGIPLAFIFIIGIFRQTFFQHRLLIGLLLILSLFGQAIVFTPFILMIIFSAFIFPRKKVISKS